MGTPNKPPIIIPPYDGDPDVQCGCFPAGAMPGSLLLFATGIVAGSDNYPSMIAAPNGTWELAYVGACRYQVISGNTRWDVWYDASGNCFIEAVDIYWAMWAFRGASAICPLSTTNLQTEPGGPPYFGWWAGTVRLSLPTNLNAPSEDGFDTRPTTKLEDLTLPGTASQVRGVNVKDKSNYIIKLQ